LVRALRDARDRTPVIVVTARDARDERLRLLDVGAATLDLVARAATFDGAAVPLTAKEFRTLAELMRRPGRFVTKSELEAAVYDDGT
jgi:DNA-binding response OmpR family regulator